MILNMTGGGSGGTGATLTITAPAGCTVAVSKDGKTKTKVAGSDGIVVFKGLATGTWTVTITDDTQTASKTVEIVTDYATSITFFSATINVTYPAGSICTATDGVTTISAPDTSGTWACVVPNAGAWTISIKGTPWSKDIVITEDGQISEADITRLYLQNGSSINYDVNLTNAKTEILGGSVKYSQGGANARSTVHIGPVNLTGSTKLQVNLRAGYVYASPNPGFCVSKEPLTGYPTSDLTRFNTNGSGHTEVLSGNYNMDISGYSGDYYVAIFWEGNESKSSYITIDKIWLEI